MTKKKALGADPLSWIRPTVDVDEESKKTEDKSTSGVDNTPSSEVLQKGDKGTPKFETYEVKLTLRLKDDQLEFLSRLEREIMKSRSSVNRRERITKNSIIRAMIDTFVNLRIDTNEISDEEELIKRLIKAIDSKGRGNLPV